MNNRLWVTAIGLASGVGIVSFILGRKTGAQKNAGYVPPSVQTSVDLPRDKKGNQPAFPYVKPIDFYQYGFPGPVHDIRNGAEFISCYNRQTRNPSWVVEHITRDSIKSSKGVDRRNSVFKEDEAIPESFRNKLKDFFRSGYDRGHNAPAADAKFSQTAMDETFYLTNMSPQVGEGFNRDYWAHFEDFARRLTNKYDSVRIVTGPLFLPKKDIDGKFRVSYEVIGNPPNVAVPTHFFKLIVGEMTGQSSVAVGAFVLPNATIPNSAPLTSFQVPVEALERSSGLELLRRLPDSYKKDLCKETTCSIIVRDFSRATKPVFSLPGKK